MTDLTKAQIATILSTLDERPRSPANKNQALKALDRSARRFGLTADEVLAAAPGLLDGRISPEEFRAGLADREDEPDTAPQAAGEAQEPAPAADGASADDAAPEPAQAAGDEPARPQVRAGTKQALMIDLLKRPEGATVEQIAERTGWQHHTIRGAISGALKKKLGLTIEATRTREVGPNKTGAKGSVTVYRITGSGPETGTPSAAG